MELRYVGQSLIGSSTGHEHENGQGPWSDVDCSFLIKVIRENSVILTIYTAATPWHI